MATKKKLDYNPQHQIALMKKINNIYNGDSMECPNCGKKDAFAKFVFFPDNIGYCVVECNSCDNCIQVFDRVARTADIKAEIEEVEW